MAERRIEKIRVFVREHLDEDPFEQMLGKSMGTSPKGSTVGVKISAGGEEYGTFMCFTKPTLSASEVTEAINELFESTLKEVEEDG